MICFHHQCRGTIGDDQTSKFRNFVTSNLLVDKTEPKPMTSAQTLPTELMNLLWMNKDRSSQKFWPDVTLICEAILENDASIADSVLNIWENNTSHMYGLTKLF